MPELSTSQVAADSGIAALLQTALEHDGLDGLCQMLRVIAETFSSLGCILWELAPGEKGENSPDSRLYVLAQRFPTSTAAATHNLSLNSVTGNVILNSRTINVMKVSSDDRVNDRHPFLTHANIESFFSVPIEFIDKSKGALNVYRQRGDPAFSDPELEAIVRVAHVVPSLYAALRDKLTYRQISEINQIMNRVDMSASMAMPSRRRIEAALQEIVDSVDRTFRPLEVSLYLKNTTEPSSTYTLCATNLPKHRMKSEYRASKDDGITGWVLATGANVRIFDFNSFDQDSHRIEREYPGLQWKDPLGIQQLARERLGLEQGDPLPPLSYMSCPILLGSNVLGAIRCTATTRGPNYYSARELGLLELIAAQIGHFWATWLNRRELEKENASWRHLIAAMSLANELAQKFVKQSNPDAVKILQDALLPICSAIPGAESFDLWLANESRTELRAVAAGGNYWDKQPPRAQLTLLGRRLYLPDGQHTIAAGVIETGLISIRTVTRGEHTTELFPDTTHVIAVPVTSEGGLLLGILYVQNSAGETFGEHAGLVAQLAAQQLGLYHNLAHTIGGRYRAELEQLQTFEDLQHQLKTPIQQAHARILMVLQSDSIDERLRIELHKVRGLCAKVKRVAMSLKLFSDLSKKHPIEANCSRVTYDSIVKMMIEAASDNALMVEPKRQIRFSVEREAFRVLTTHHVELDQDLLEQALNNLLDNAGKYSYSNTMVRIFGGITGKGRFHVSVVNKGIPIRHSEASRLVERGYRSEDAQATGDGTGIGLWMVDHIMRAHGGTLLVIPSNPDGMTEMKLMFPVIEKAVLQ